MVKPIFLIQIPDTITPEKMQEISDKWVNKLNDWHVIVSTAATSYPVFTAFTEYGAKNISEEDLQELGN